MATVGAEVTNSWFLSSGVFLLFLLLLVLSIFLTSLCSDCFRRSFELRDSSVEKTPSTLIKVVKLEDAMMARENPTIDEIRSDEKENRHSEENQVQVTARSSHLVAPQISQEMKSEDQISIQVPPWRSHLTGPQTHGVNGAAAPESDHIYHTIGEEKTAADSSTPAANHELRSAVADDVADGNMTSVYARVSKVTNASSAAVHTPAQVQEEEEEASPPLPGRSTEVMEG